MNSETIQASTPSDHAELELFDLLRRLMASPLAEIRDGITPLKGKLDKIQTEIVNLRDEAEEKIHSQLSPLRASFEEKISILSAELKKIEADSEQGQDRIDIGFRQLLSEALQDRETQSAFSVSHQRQIDILQEKIDTAVQAIAENLQNVGLLRIALLDREKIQARWRRMVGIGFIAMAVIILLVAAGISYLIWQTYSRGN